MYFKMTFTRVQNTKNTVKKYKPCIMVQNKHKQFCNQVQRSKTNTNKFATRYHGTKCPETIYQKNTNTHHVRGGRHLPLSTPSLIRGAMALHTPSSNGQHCRPVCGLKAGPRPYEYEQVHKEPQGTAHAVWYDPFLYPVSNYVKGRKKILPLEGTPKQPYPRSHHIFLLK